MACDPRWDPWVLDERAALNIRGSGGTSGYGTNCLDLISSAVQYFPSVGGFPIEGDVVLRISAIKDPELNDNGAPKDNVPTEVVVDSGEVSGMRKGDTLVATFISFILGDKQEDVEYEPDQLVGDKVIVGTSYITIELSIESMGYDAIGPFPRGDVEDINNMFWENKAMDCKASGDDQSLRLIGSRDPYANYPIDIVRNKWDSYCGWEKLFTGDRPNDGRQSGKHAKKGTCLQLATNNQQGKEQGIILGGWQAHQVNETARWMNPTGIQFEWTTKNTPKNNANGLKLQHLWLIYKEAKDGVPRYARVIDQNQAMGEYVWERNDLISSFQKKDQYGRFRASLSAEDIIQVNARDAVCIAMMMVFQNAKAGAVYYNIIDIYNFTFLFYNAKGTIDEFTGLPVPETEPSLPTKSRLIVPAPFPMKDWDSGRFPIF